MMASELVNRNGEYESKKRHSFCSLRGFSGASRLLTGDTTNEQGEGRHRNNT